MFNVADESSGYITLRYRGTKPKHMTKPSKFLDELTERRKSSTNSLRLDRVRKEVKLHKLRQSIRKMQQRIRDLHDRLQEMEIERTNLKNEIRELNHQISEQESDLSCEDEDEGFC